MIRNGSGGANTNANGLRFERNTSFEEFLASVGYSFTPVAWSDGKERVKAVHTEGGELVGLYMPKRALNQFLQHEFGFSMKQVLSVNLLPDEAFYNECTDTLHIVEKKFQMCSGSVDEKIQTGPF